MLRVALLVVSLVLAVLVVPTDSDLGLVEPVSACPGDIPADCDGACKPMCGMAFEACKPICGMALDACKPYCAGVLEHCKPMCEGLDD